MIVGDTAGAFSLVRTTRAQTVDAPVQLNDERGQPLTQLIDIRQRWARYFQSLLHGRFTTFDDLRRAALQHESDARTTFAPGQLDLAIAPTLSQLIPKHRKAKCGRGFGEDSLPNELYRLASRPTVAVTMRLCLKATLRVQEPLVWRGSHITELYKQKGDIRDCVSYRDIHLKYKVTKF